MILVLLFLATCFLAYSNGANDNFKGVASLLGSRTCTYRTAICWTTITTLAGSIISIFLAQKLLTKFSGKGIVSDHFVGSEYFVLAVAIGAGLTVILATLTGFPISTTHALTGAIIGCGLVAVGLQVNFAALGQGFILPLLLSPVLAMVIAAILYIIFHALRVGTATSKEWCICVGTEERVVTMPQPSSAFALRSVTSAVTLSIDEQQNCRERYAGSFLGVSSQQIVARCISQAPERCVLPAALTTRRKLSRCSSCGKHWIFAGVLRQLHWPWRSVVCLTRVRSRTR